MSEHHDYKIHIFTHRLLTRVNILNRDLQFDPYFNADHLPDGITILHNFKHNFTAHFQREELLQKLPNLFCTRFFIILDHADHMYNYYFIFHYDAGPTDWNPIKHRHISKWSNRFGSKSIQTRWMRKWITIRWNMRKEGIVSRKRRSESPVSAVWTLTCSFLYLIFLVKPCKRWRRIFERVSVQRRHDSSLTSKYSTYVCRSFTVFRL